VGAQGGADLGSGAEVLGAAGKHHLGVVGDRAKQGLQVVGGVVEADPQFQLVESVEEQREPPAADHVPQLRHVEGVHVLPDPTASCGVSDTTASSSGSSHRRWRVQPRSTPVA